MPLIYPTWQPRFLPPDVRPTDYQPFPLQRLVLDLAHDLPYFFIDNREVYGLEPDDTIEFVQVAHASDFKWYDQNTPDGVGLRIELSDPMEHEAHCGAAIVLRDYMIDWVAQHDVPLQWAFDLFAAGPYKGFMSNVTGNKAPYRWGFSKSSEQ